METKYKEKEIRFDEDEELFVCNIKEYGVLRDKSLKVLKQMIDKVLKGEFNRETVFFSSCIHSTPIEGTVTSKVSHGYQANSHYFISYKDSVGANRREQIHRERIFVHNEANAALIADMKRLDAEIAERINDRKTLYSRLLHYKESEV